MNEFRDFEVEDEQYDETLLACEKDMLIVEWLLYFALLWM